MENVEKRGFLLINKLMYWRGKVIVLNPLKQHTTIPTTSMFESSFKQQPVDKNLIELHLEASTIKDNIINKKNMGKL